MRIDNLNNAALEVTHHYLACALWASVDENDTPLDDLYDLTDISQEFHTEALKDCKRLLTHIMTSRIALPDTYTLDALGHDLWLTRNGHGAGIWDRGLGIIGEELDDYITENFLQIDLYITDDKKVAA